MLDPTTLVRAVELYQQGWGLRPIAGELGVGWKWLYRQLPEQGVPIRNQAVPLSRNTQLRGYHVDKHGYVSVRMPEHPQAKRWDGHVSVHRVVMEDRLGRYLTPDEVIDHRDGDTSNNHPDNLRLFPSNAEHLRTTLTGIPKLPAHRREQVRREAVQRATSRVDAILSGSGTGADPSLSWWPRPSTAPHTKPRSLLRTGARESEPEPSHETDPMPGL
jgi:hypothetical protein